MRNLTYRGANCAALFFSLEVKREREEHSRLMIPSKSRVTSCDIDYYPSNSRRHIQRKRADGWMDGGCRRPARVPRYFLFSFWHHQKTTTKATAVATYFFIIIISLSLLLGGNARDCRKTPSFAYDSSSESFPLIPFPSYSRIMWRIGSKGGFIFLVYNCRLSR